MVHDIHITKTIMRSISIIFGSKNPYTRKNKTSLRIINKIERK